MSGNTGSSAPSRHDRPIQRRTGGRTAKVTDQALSAAARILLEEGYEALGHRQVAAEAGVADTTIYRRWPTKAKLVLAALEHLASQAIVVPDLGSFEQDLSALAHQVIDYLAQPAVGKMVSALVAALAEEDGAQEARSAFWRGRFAGTSLMIERAVARGEVPPGVDHIEVIETLAAPIYLRLLITGGPLDGALAKRVVLDTLKVHGMAAAKTKVRPR